MSRILSIAFVLTLAVGVNINTASAQLIENFDSYTNGTVLDDPASENGWQGWDDVVAVAGTVTTAQASSPRNSMKIDVFDDAVNEMGSPSTGAHWRLRLEMYIPSGSTGQPAN